MVTLETLVLEMEFVQHDNKDGGEYNCGSVVQVSKIFVKHYDVIFGAASFDKLLFIFNAPFHSSLYGNVLLCQAGCIQTKTDFTLIDPLPDIPHDFTCTFREGLMRKQP